MDFVYALPNSYPYNELLLSGKLSAKTREWKWNHSGLVLLYTSTSTAKGVVKAHGLPKEHETGVLVGYGFLRPVRYNTWEEQNDLEREFNNDGEGSCGVFAGLYRYEFSELIRFKKPIPFKPKQGSVRVLRVPIQVIEGKIPARTLRAWAARVERLKIAMKEGLQQHESHD